jgi:hypothetical protein
MATKSHEESQIVPRNIVINQASRNLFFVSFVPLRGYAAQYFSRLK